MLFGEFFIKDLEKTFCEKFPNLFRRLQKKTEDCQRQPKKIWRSFDHMHISKNLSVDKGTNKIVIKNDIVTCEDIISVQFYQFVATLYIQLTFIQWKELTIWARVPWLILPMCRPTWKGYRGWCAGSSSLRSSIEISWKMYKENPQLYGHQRNMQKCAYLISKELNTKKQHNYADWFKIIFLFNNKLDWELQISIAW